MNKILFIGTFQSRRTGAKTVSEKLKQDLKNDTISIELTSYIKNKFLRFVDIIFAVSFKKYNLLHIDTFSGMAFRIAEIASKIASLKKKPIILTLHGGALPEFHIANKKRIKKVFNRAILIQTPSLYLQDYFAKQGIKINYLPNPISLENFPYDRKQVKPKTLLWVRAFTAIYNPDLAIESLYEIRKIFPETTLTMIGPDKGTLAETKKIIHQLNLEDAITIKGAIKNEKLYKYYQTHSIFLNTTSYESFGVAVVEAASCGIPIVSTKVGEIPYLWEHEKNILMSEIEINKFASEVIKLLKSEDLQQKLSKNAREKAVTFKADFIYKKWSKILLNYV